MPGRIDAYLDCASPYSYLALLHLRRIRPALSSYDITIEIHPVFLGGINVATGNKPPGTLPARGLYSPYDLARAVVHFDTVPLSAPPFFPMLSILPQRAMLVIKERHDLETYETIYARTWVYCFNMHVDISKRENLERLLGEFLDRDEVQEVLRLAGTQKFKDLLASQTKKCVESFGAFGCPWLWLTNEQGKSEPVFGSDRWVYVYRFLGVEFEDVKIVEKRQEEKAKL